MRTNQFSPLRVVATLLALAMLPVIAPPTSTTGAQDQTFRLMNVERRLDQLQIRVDAVERSVQSMMISAANQANSQNSSDIATRALLELQRQQLSMAEQVVMMQKRMLEMQKAIDRLTAREAETEKPDKKEQPKEEAKPKVQPKKPG